MLVPLWQYLLVQVGPHLFALPRECVSGVSRMHPLALLPGFAPVGSPAPHLGASLVSVRQLFGLPEWLGPDSCIVYVPASDPDAVSPHAGLIVDGVPRLMALGGCEARAVVSGRPAVVVADASINGRPVQIVDVRALLRAELAAAA